MKLPVKEIIKSIPGLVGIRLEEEPNYTVVLNEEPFQVRRYNSFIEAKTSVALQHDAALDEGFSRLANYIFGDNKSAKTMSMTTPVLQTPEESAWNISFVLPSDLSLENAPRPSDSRVHLIEREEMVVACYRYSGNNTQARMKTAQQELLAWVKRKNFKIAGEIFWAQYDQPFAVPFLKRNEALIAIVY